MLLSNKLVQEVTVYYKWFPYSSNISFIFNKNFKYLNPKLKHVVLLPIVLFDLFYISSSKLANAIKTFSWKQKKKL